MKDIQVDEAGELRCATCGGKNFTERRTNRARLGGGAAGVLTFGVAGAAAPLLTKKKLRCQACGAFNQTGNAQRFTGNSPSPNFAASARPVRSAAPPKEASDTEAILGIIVMVAIGIGVFAWAISSGSVLWSIITGVLTALLVLGLVATIVSAANPKPQKPAHPARSATPRPPAPDTQFVVRKPPPHHP
ncbi:hypothetical protein [Gordonia caeni]|uniref:Zinc ribbon domain-containing protein n=1 Tax=Gordonia caeni TaxID=1007097 RepID=A0ABP7PBY2_9ACTN